MSGPEADEFRLRVQQAATGPPWYSHAVPRVIEHRSLCFVNVCTQLIYVRFFHTALRSGFSTAN